MRSSTELVIAVTPMGAVRVTQGSRWSPRAQRYETYKQEIRFAMPRAYELPAELELEFHIPMPRSWSKKKREAMRLQPHQSRPDIDNLAKGFMDAFGTEDSHVWRIRASKRWADEGTIIVRPF